MSKPNEQVFTGTSNNGNLQEALDEAITRAGHGVPWRLASIDGVTGFAGNQVNARIFAVTQAARDKDGGGGEEPVFEVPTSRTGLVVDISEQISICQDGAKYELVSQTEEGEQRLRLNATNPDAERVLADAAGTRQEVRVSGYIRRVECERMDVYDAAPATDVQADRPVPGEGGVAETRQGTVEKIPEGTLSFCQDGAEFELVSTTPEGEERMRLRAANGRAGSVLKRFAGTGEEVSVIGPVSHVECTVLDVVEAHPVRAAAGSPQA